MGRNDMSKQILLAYPRGFCAGVRRALDTVDKVLEHLMTCGQKVAGGDRLGKTIEPCL